MKLVSGLLLLLSAYVGIRHGLGTLSNSPSAEELKMMAALGITEPVRKAIAGLSLALGLLVLLPPTFFMANLLRAVMIIVTMGLSLKAANVKFALIEIPFLLMPLVLIYLGHPFKN